MNEAEIVNFDLNIGGVIIPMEVASNQLPAIKEAEKEMKDLYDTWKLEFPNKSTQELLGMIAYQYVRFYHELESRYKSAIREAASLEYMLDRLVKECGD